jgi:hypothetical protein|nr:MAG TPA: hypothetical protein [Bacteriophage sp.]
MIIEILNFYQIVGNKTATTILLCTIPLNLIIAEFFR